ncbi:hypothetical protein Z517_06835 [Fonsecaea pedrosoi CBS 271.37]|uniref:Chlorophyll synthesis pathway protein BchC n=1 Tax=Fonsecaea pedrosoi CBS 271.37 TaxID=1442368 RepID=A0A0D2GNR4_9EURO|nr:uncharacterized protein Z517_06835 [Fonsecaea pedrosoi CBS 271.37]KIW80220.1 hypothetical protein Z517_06835 [Fonsecaea pedrosoi CBS 271.37]
MGHEFCGRVFEIPPGTKTGLKLGQSVMVDPRICCRQCSRCTSDVSNMCTKWAFLGLFGGGGGGLSQYVAVDADMCHPVPESILPWAALIEPLVVARHALKLLDSDLFKPSTTALVIGGGPIGLGVIHNLRVKGMVTKIIVSEPSPTRRAQVARFCLEALDPTVVDVAERCLAHTGGIGVDILVDCAGVEKAFKDGFKALGPRGAAVMVAGITQPDLKVPITMLMGKELRLHGSLAYDESDFREVVEEFVTGKFDEAKSMITSRIKVDDVVEKGFEELLRNKDNQIKILVTPKDLDLTKPIS